jgi:ATP-binding cassette subfamily B protein
MKLLYSYLKQYWTLVLLALFLATINQTFSLLDPLVFRYVIDNYAMKFKEYTTDQFLQGVVSLLLMAMGVAFVSRVAKNFQDYYINVITQRLGAKIYADGLKHSLELPIQSLRISAVERRLENFKRSALMSNASSRQASISSSPVSSVSFL